VQVCPQAKSRSLRLHKTGLKTREKSWGPTPSDVAFWLATLPLHPTDAVRVKKANDSVRVWRETAWGRPKVFFGPDTPPLNLIGGYRFAGVPEIELAV
jgi:hypothetical protein